MKYEQISKNHDKIKELVKMLKNNHEKHLSVVDDLFALSLIIKYDLPVVNFFFVEENIYREEAESIKQALLLKADHAFSISSKTMNVLLQKENASNMIAVTKLPIASYERIKDCDFIVIADRIELPGNLGTILRTMDAVGAQALISVDPITKLCNPKLVHSSRGMNLLIPQLEDSYQNVLMFLLKNNYQIYLGEPELGTSYEKLDYQGKIAIVIGSERYGINPDWYNHDNQKVYIPMQGEMKSLNVGVAASILLYEAYMKRKPKIK